MITGRFLPHVLLLILGASVAPVLANPNAGGHPRIPATERVVLARAILQNPRIQVLKYHVSGVRDEATAYLNLIQTANAQPVKRSYYGRAPGGTTRLNVQMLRAIHQLTREGFSFRITELAGGSHAAESRHYDGLAFDIDYLNGQKVSLGHPLYRRFLKRCQQLGATQVLGPGTPGHRSHLHIAWSASDPESES